MDILSSAGLPSPCPHQNHSHKKLTLAAVQMRWHADAQLHKERLELAVSNAANAGAAAGSVAPAVRGGGAKNSSLRRRSGTAILALNSLAAFLATVLALSALLNLAALGAGFG